MDRETEPLILNDKGRKHTTSFSERVRKLSVTKNTIRSVESFNDAFQVTSIFAIKNSYNITISITTILDTLQP